MTTRWTWVLVAGALLMGTGCRAADAEATKGGGGGNHAVEAYEGDLAFLDGLVPHHRVGVSLAEEAIAKSTRAEVKALATAMRTEDARAIQALAHQRNKLVGEVETPPVVDPKPGAIPAGRDFDARWTKEAIRHHRTTIDLATRALGESEKPEIKALAKRVIADEAAEVRELEQIARKL